MWPDFPFAESAIFSASSPFKVLRAQVEKAHARNANQLLTGFKGLLRGEEAQGVRNVVLVWALAQSYCHSDGKLEPSTVVYIEKTKDYISRRWPPRRIELLVTGADGEAPADSPDLRKLANQDNLLFYRTIIAKYGPLRVWWAGVDDLKAASNRALADLWEWADPRDWERHLLTGYRECYGCLPLKNRRR